MALKKRVVGIILLMEILMAIFHIGDLICDYSNAFPLGSVIRTVILSACVFISRNKSLKIHKSSVFIGIIIFVLGIILQFTALFLWCFDAYIVLGYIVIIVNIAYWFGIFKGKKIMSVKTVAIIILGAFSIGIVSYITYCVNTKITEFFNPRLGLYEGGFFALIESFNAKIPKISYIIHIAVKTLCNIAILAACEKYLEEHDAISA